MAAHNVLCWIDDLKARGIQEFVFAELPEDLQNKVTFGRAWRRGHIAKTGKTAIMPSKYPAQVWRIL